MRRTRCSFWGESSRRLNPVIRLQQARFGRVSYHANLLARLGRAASGCPGGRADGRTGGHVMMLRTTLTSSIPVAHETPKVAEQSTKGDRGWPVRGGSTPARALTATSSAPTYE